MSGSTTFVLLEIFRKIFHGAAYGEWSHAAEAA
jgi:hypothetical protein